MGFTRTAGTALGRGRELGRRFVADATGRLGVRDAVHGAYLRSPLGLDRELRARNRSLRNRGAPDGFPLPPPRDAFLVTGIGYDLEHYIESGHLAAESLRETLAEAGEAPEGLSPVLDFGCGCGRVLRHLHGPDGPELHGADFNARMIRWCRTSLPFATYEVSGGQPPLPYADATFGLVVAVAVFCNLNEPLQAMWRDELTRVLRPGGLLYLTVHGDTYLDLADRAGGTNADAYPDAVLEAYRQGRLGVCGADNGDGDGLVDDYVTCQVIHPHSYVRDVLAERLELVAYRPGGARDSAQDEVLLRHPHTPVLSGRSAQAP